MALKVRGTDLLVRPAQPSTGTELAGKVKTLPGSLSELRRSGVSNEWDAFVEGVKDGEFDDLLDELPPEDLQ